MNIYEQHLLRAWNKHCDYPNGYIHPSKCSPGSSEQLSAAALLRSHTTIDWAFIIDESVPGSLVEQALALNLTPEQTRLTLEYWRRRMNKSIHTLADRFLNEALRQCALPSPSD
jgi:hypothetical protein